VSWYRLIISIYIVFFSSLQAKGLMVVPDDELIMRGLLYDEYKAYNNSRKIYATLFDKTDEEIYLFKEVTASLLGRTHLFESIKRLKTWGSKHNDVPEVQRLLIPLYLTANKITEAKVEAEYLLEHSSNIVDLELASNPFLYAGEFKRALVLLNKVYAVEPNEKILLRMADIMDEYTNERNRAIQMLETHRRMESASNDILAKLLVLYSKEKDIDGLMETYKVLYEQSSDERILIKIMDAYAYKRDSMGAIVFLEKYQVGDDMLYDLYKSKQLFTKALVLAKRIYKQNKDARWLAEQGILLFEKATDKNDKKMINAVVSSFDEAMRLGVDDSVYLNYYGYILIDKEIDIQKGMDIIQEALVQQPNNTYYLDSLAWGYYKTRKCSQAYKLMKRVVDEEGLEEDEIIAHWHAIKQCK